MMGLMGTLHRAPLHTVPQQKNAGDRRSSVDRTQIRAAADLRRVLLSRQGWGFPNSWEGHAACSRSRGLQVLHVRQPRSRLTRCSAEEIYETEDDREEQGLEVPPHHRRSLTRSSAADRTDEALKEQAVVEVVTSSPSLDTLTEMDSTITVRRSSSSAPVRNQPQKSGRGGLQWILGPLALLITGALPALWLPSPVLFSGSATAGLLALAGLDTTFNLGATAFLLMADSSARSDTEDPSSSQSSIPLGYKVWSFFVNLVGLAAPVALVVASRRGVLQFQPALPMLPAAALLGPYTLLMVVQWLAEVLVWKWQSPVWPVLPLVYQAYRLLQLTRGIELGVALESPAWLVEAVKGLVAWWVFVLGMQIMWVAWLVGTIQTRYARRS